MDFEFPPGVSPRNVARYTAVLEAAKLARPTPFQSNYYVRGAAMTKSGRIVSGGNHEYAVGNAIHCEETLVARALEEGDPSVIVDPIAILGFLDQSFSPESVSYPCGNCRDTLRQYADPRMVILGVGLDGGRVVVNPFRDVLYEPKRRVSVDDLLALDHHAIAVAEEQRGMAFLEHLPAEMHQWAYGAAAINADGEVFGARYFSGGSYHGSNALWNALVKAQDSLPVERVIVTGPRKPFVPYKDRQRLAEFAMNDNGGEPIEVLLARTVNSRPVQAWRTDSSEWIPKTFVFSIGG